MLILAPSHPIELTQLLNKLVHSKHCRCKSLWFLVYIFRALYDLVVQYLVRICEISHFCAENCTVLDHLCSYSTLAWDNVVHWANVFSFFFIFHYFLKFFDIVIFKPLNEKWVRLKFFTSSNSLQKSGEIFFSSFNWFITFLFLFHW